ncbi:uncharacterized protein [Diadema antillarum]|uniref:uncharacterized protein n=1 Tax=Diadema antillarum TaxID=105358 RepID=UPI003A870069
MHAVIMDPGDSDRWESVSPIASSTAVMLSTTLPERVIDGNASLVVNLIDIERHKYLPGSKITSVEHEHYVEPSETMVVMMIIMVVILSLTVTLSNVLVLHVIRLDRTLHTVGNMFTASLAVADLLVGVFVIPFNIFDILSVTRWQDHPNSARSIWVTMDFFFTTASIMNLVLLNLDRFWSITSPIKYIRQRTRRRAMMLIAGVWGVPVVLIFGPATTWKLAFKSVPVPSRTMFVFYKAGSWLMAAGAVFTYIIPLFVLCAIYSQIYRAIHRRAKMDVGRSSIASSAMSTRPGSSRRDSESQHNFITEHELQRLKGIYEKTVRRERGERQLMAMIRRRSRGYGTGAREVRRYASIDEEDHEARCDEDESAECEENFRKDTDAENGSIYEGVNDNSAPSSDGKLADVESSDVEHDDGCSEESFEIQGGEREALMTRNESAENERRVHNESSKGLDDLNTSPRLQVRPRSDRMSVDSPTSKPRPHLSPRSLKPERLECDLFSNGMVMCPNCSPSSRGSSRGSSPSRRLGNSMESACESMNHLTRSPGKNPSPVFPSSPEKCESEVPSLPLKPDQVVPLHQNGDVIHCNGIVKRSVPESIITTMQESSFTTSSENIEASPRDDASVSLTESDPAILSDVDSETALQAPSKRRTSFSFDLINETTHCRCNATIADTRPSMRSLSYPKSDQRTSFTFPMDVAAMNGFRSRVRQSFSTSFSALSGRGSKAMMLLRKQDKAAKQLGIILTCLIVCWTPYFFQVLLYSFVYDIGNTKAMTIAVYLGYAHSFLNPILYAMFNLRFQRAFRRVICACCFREEISPRPCSVPPSLI